MKWSILNTIQEKTQQCILNNDSYWFDKYLPITWSVIDWLSIFRSLSPIMLVTKHTYLPWKSYVMLMKCSFGSVLRRITVSWGPPLRFDTRCSHWYLGGGFPSAEQAKLVLEYKVAVVNLSGPTLFIIGPSERNVIHKYWNRFQ